MLLMEGMMTALAASATELLQIVAWFLGLLELVLGLYIILSNVRNVASQRVGGLLVLLAVSAFAMGLLFVAADVETAAGPTFVLALTAPLIGFGLLAVTLTFTHPRKFAVPIRGRGANWSWWLVLAILLLPLLLTLIDEIFSLDLWYTGLNSVSFGNGLMYPGGFVPLSAYVAGKWADIILMLYVYVPPLLVLLPLFLALRPQSSASPSRRRWLWWLLGGQVLAQFTLLIIDNLGMALLISQLVYMITFAYVGFQAIISGHAVPRTSLRFRLTALMLVTTAPILVVGVLMVGSQALMVIETKEVQRLAALNDALSANIQAWLTQYEQVLRELSVDPAIVSMDPVQQKPLLATTAKVYPNVYLVSTTDLAGINVARSDDVSLKDYHERVWFKQASVGKRMVFQLVVGRTSGVPAIVGALPIKDDRGEVVGVVMFASTLADISLQVRASKVGESGYAYIVDADNRVLAHPDAVIALQVMDFSDRVPIRILREGAVGAALTGTSGEPFVKFRDAGGMRWWVYVSEVGPGWGVIVQQTEAELLGGTRQFSRISWGVTLVSVSMLFVLSLFTLRQALHPIAVLTETVNAIAQGDLTRAVEVEGEDEIGVLAQAFNTMTAQLNELIQTLELRVSERTQQLERRAEYLAITAQVSRVANTILDVDQLLERIANLISERFGFYHTGIFIVDAAGRAGTGGEWAVLRAVSSAGGRQMLARGHRLRVGEQGIVGHVSGTGRPRIALDVDADAVWVKNPDLPATRSEMALPLLTVNQVIGVLDIQSTAPDAFSTEDIETLRILADQVAIAIQNARLFQTSQQSIRELQRAYGAVGIHGWADRTSLLVGYTYTPEARGPLLRGDSPTGVGSAITVEDTQIVGSNTLVVPLRLIGGAVFAALRLRRDPAYPWTEPEMGFVKQAAQSIAQSLEVARLIESTRDQAARDRLLGEIGSQLRMTLDPDTIMQTTVQTLGQALGAQLTTIEMVRPESQAKLRNTPATNGRRNQSGGGVIRMPSEIGRHQYVGE